MIYTYGITTNDGETFLPEWHTTYADAKAAGAALPTGTPYSVYRLENYVHEGGVLRGDTIELMGGGVA